MMISRSGILILDFGSQYSQLIARRVRELGVYSELHSPVAVEEIIQQFQPAGIILSGGPESVTGDATPRIPDAVFAAGCPVLGICYGMQAMALQHGGAVKSNSHREFGYAEVEVLPSILLEGIEDRFTNKGQALLDVWMSHGDQVSTLPSGFKVIASTANCPIAAMANETQQLFALQFHPEVTHTRQGERILRRFVMDICACKSEWSAKNILEEQLKMIRSQVGTEQVILGLSGGVDSSVAAVLLQQAIGTQLTCVFVDTGLLRLNEAAQVQALFQKHFGIQLVYVEAQERFYQALTNIQDPEEKRKIIGKLFIEVFEEQAEKLKKC